MKTHTIFDHIKCIITDSCDAIEDHKTEIQEEETGIENVDTDAKLDFQLFDIDSVFAN